MRELKLKTIYKHFKGKEYFTLCKSTPMSNDEYAKATLYAIPVVCRVVCRHTENNDNVLVYLFKNGEYHHIGLNENLVIYIALYDNFNIYARPYDIFMGKIDKIKYPNAKQKYRFEEI